LRVLLARLSFPTRRSSDLAVCFCEVVLVFGILSIEDTVPPGRLCLESLSPGAQPVGGKDAGAANQGPSDGEQPSCYFRWHVGQADRKSTRLNSSHVKISYA